MALDFVAPSRALDFESVAEGVLKLLRVAVPVSVLLLAAILYVIIADNKNPSLPKQPAPRTDSMGDAESISGSTNQPGDAPGERVSDAGATSTAGGTEPPGGVQLELPVLAEYRIVVPTQVDLTTRTAILEAGGDDCIVFDLGISEYTKTWHYFAVCGVGIDAEEDRVWFEQTAIAAFEVHSRRGALLAAAASNSNAKLARTAEEADELATTLRRELGDDSGIAFYVAPDGRQGVFPSSIVFADEGYQWWQHRLEQLKAQAPEGASCRGMELVAP